MMFIWYILIGILAGYLAGKIVRGGGMGLLVNLIVGIIGGVLGGWLFGIMGIWTTGVAGYAAKFQGYVQRTDEIAFYVVQGQFDHPSGICTGRTLFW